MRIFRKNRKNGFSTLSVILLMLVLAVSGVTISSFISSGMSVSMGQLQSTCAFYIAEAGLEWAARAITYVSGSADFSGGGRHIDFRIRNRTGSNIRLTGFTVTWDSPSAYYERVRINGGAYSNTVIWNYPGGVRAGDGDNITFNTGPNVILASGTAYTLQLRNFNNQQTGSGSNADVRNANFRFAFNFIQAGTSSKNFAGGTFTISASAVSATENAQYTSTASKAGFSRANSMASVCGFQPSNP